jgi:hypothetical protein
MQIPKIRKVRPAPSTTAIHILGSPKLSNLLMAESRLRLTLHFSLQWRGKCVLPFPTHRCR